MISSRTDEWRWYEGELTYCNAVLPQAMLMCGQWVPNNTMSEVGLESLTWLADLQRADKDGGHFVPIGSNGFYPRKGARAYMWISYSPDLHHWGSHKLMMEARRGAW